MIIKNTYFKGDIYLPHAKPSAGDGAANVESDVIDFINEYSYDCLIKCLGSVLFHEFTDELDHNKPSGLKDTADAKWDELLNGESYTDADGNKVVWRGIRFKSIETGEYDKSFLANYVYFHYESNDFITRSSAGTQREAAKNAEMVLPTQKVVKAWRKFISQVQGSQPLPNVTVNSFGIGVDYYGIREEQISMYRFINDKNALLEDTYADFNPKTWENINQMGI